MYKPENNAPFYRFFRIHIQFRIRIRNVYLGTESDPAKSFGSFRIRFRIRFRIQIRNTADPDLAQNLVADPDPDPDPGGGGGQPKMCIPPGKILGTPLG
jgi:hypothetical protein